MPNNSSDAALEVADFSHVDFLNLPGHKDWTGIAVTDPQYQDKRDSDNCDGSSYAFSATASMEALNYFKHGTLEQLSVQQIIDCSDG